MCGVSPRFSWQIKTNGRPAGTRVAAGVAPGVAAGVIDVKNSYIETADDVAERIETVLGAGVPPERLTLVPDCGFSQTARWMTRAKLGALVAGRDLVLARTNKEDR